MKDFETSKLKALAYVLRETEKQYPHQSIDSVIRQIEARIQERTKQGI